MVHREKPKLAFLQICVTEKEKKSVEGQLSPDLRSRDMQAIVL